MKVRAPATTQVVWRSSGGAAGLLSVALGIAGGFMEMALSGPWPPAGDPAYGPFLELNRGAVVAQSLLFLFGQGALLWFLGFVAARLRKAEGQHGVLSMVAFGAGVVALAFNIAASGVQLVLTMPTTTALAPEVLALIPTTGPLSPLGEVTTVLRLVPIVWYLPAAIVMLRTRQ